MRGSQKRRCSMPTATDIQAGGSGLSTLMSDILKHLGTIKNELLIFVVLVIIITNSFAYALVKTQDMVPKLCGVGMSASTVLMIFLFGMFYAYAMVRLPGTKQELMFLQGAEKSITAHAKALGTTPDGPVT
jgi:hypothetical protein